MDMIAGLIYGILQGITEFAPVSSSGHLALIPKYLNFKDPGVFFDLSMHIGTGFAVVVYYRDEIWSLIKAFFRLFKFEGTDYKDKSFAINMFISTITTFVFVLLSKLLLPEIGRSEVWIAINLAVFGVLMYVADKKAAQLESLSLTKNQHYFAAFFIGLSQSFAIFPGVSRSGITLTASRIMGMTRKNASDYSFLLSLPIIFGGFVFEYFELGIQSIEGSLPEMFFGMFVSFIFGLITIHFFVKTISKIGLMPFAIYRVILAGIILVTLCS